MASKDELSNRLLSRFKDVPSVEKDDTDGWIEMSMNEHGFDGQDDVPTKYIGIVMLYAEADGASQIALRTAYFFDYRDKDETVNKSKVAEQYRKLAETLWNKYKTKRFEGVEEIGGSQFSIMTRVDRP